MSGLDAAARLHPASSTPDQFVELYVPDPAPYLTLFVDCLGYRVESRLDGWIDLRRDGDRLLLNSEDEQQLGEDHPFAGGREVDTRGYGVELAIVVDDDLVEICERVRERGIGLKIETVRMRPWGVRDFRVMTTDGYYIRVTERQRA